MKSKMRRTLKVLYPDEFGKRGTKIKKLGFIAGRWNSFKQYLSGVEKVKLTISALVVVSAGMMGYGAYAYNHFTAFTNDILTASSNIEKEKQRRNDLINNLVPPTLNYSLFEKELFSHVVEIRKELTTLNNTMYEYTDGDSEITGKIKTQLPSLLGIFENYPDLKASTTFSDLMKELIETENRVALAREIFNKNVNMYNTYISKVPAAWVAKGLGYEMHPWFKATDNASIVPDMRTLDSVNSKKSINLRQSDINARQ